MSLLVVKSTKFVPVERAQFGNSTKFIRMQVDIGQNFSSKYCDCIQCRVSIHFQRFEMLTVLKN